MINEQVVVTVGGQAGSEGKGAVTARLAQDRAFDYAVRVGGPNAGHTVIDVEGNRFALRQLPVAAAVDPDVQLVIAAGSEIDLAVLLDEVAELEFHGHLVQDRLIIDAEATVIEPKHQDMEKQLGDGRTTGKGIGAARAERAMRKARRMTDFRPQGLQLEDTGRLLRRGLRHQKSILLEGTQGYVLGSHAGYYPFCTSGNCRAIDFMAAAGLPPMEVTTWLVLRTYPIRIAGDSGPLAHETTWERIGVEPEITTVTRKVRRVGAWDIDWARASTYAHKTRPANDKTDPRIALTFADYWWEELLGEDGEIERGALPPHIEAQLDKLEMELGARIHMLGTGPASQLRRI